MNSIPRHVPCHALAVLLVLLAIPASARVPAGWLAVSSALAPAGAGIDFTPHGTQPGLFNDLQPAVSCSGCHGLGGAAPAESAEAFRPFTTWAGSMMANATRDPVFWAALDVANHDVPGVGDYCLRCHTAKGWYGGHVIKTGFGGADNDVTLGAAGCLLTGTYDRRDDTDNDFSGLNCHFCHRLSPTGPNGEPAYVGNANAWVDDQPCANTGDGEPCRRGPFDYADGDPSPPHAWEYSAFHTESAICGTCHDVTTPDTDAGPLKTLKLADGTDTGHPFPIERTFSEWRQSQYAQAGGQTCQGCHMPVSDDPDATACALGGYPNRSGSLAVHAFVGGNTWVPRIISGEFGDTGDIPGSWGGVGRANEFAQTIRWARQMLASSATVETTLGSYTPPTGAAAGSLAIQVKVTNLSGHKLPTGYSEGRRMWINLQVRDASGALVYQSGAYDAATGVLDRDADARVYEVLQGIWDHNGDGACDTLDAGGTPMFHFALGDCIAKDNRIPPLGFQPATTDDPQGYDTRPVPVGSYPETAPGSGVLVNYDVVPYQVTVPAGTPTPLHVAAALYYQTSSKDYIDFLQSEAATNGFAGENAMCSGQSNRPFVVGPQDRTRGQYIHDLWSDDDRIYGQGFDDRMDRRSYGKSPPELIQDASAVTTS
jgi:hypothetical protein